MTKGATGQDEDTMMAEKIPQTSRESDEDHIPMELMSDKTSAGSTTENNDFPKDNVNQISEQEITLTENDLYDKENVVHHRAAKNSGDVKHQRDGPGQTENNHEADQTERKKCQACRKCCLSCWKPCLTKYHPLTSNASRCQKLKHALMCPPHGKLAHWATLSLSVIIFWGVLWAVTGPKALPGPDGSLFGILVVLVLAVIGGQLVSLIRLPPLLGMLIVGCLLRNVPYIDVAKNIDTDWSSALRSIALVVILTRAGLGLDPVALRRLSFGVIRLAFIPCLVETLVAAVCSHLFLGFPWIWGFMLGFVLAAVSPAVVVPSMLALNEKGYGVDKGIPTLVIAAASVDDVLAISGFGVVLGIAFSQGNLALIICKGPLEALLGVVYGIVFGIVCWFLPHAKHGNKTLFQFIILFCGGLFAQFGSREADLSGAGALGCLTMAFVAALRWRKEVPEGEDPKVNAIFSYLWLIFQPLLFGLIGAEIDISSIQAKTIGLGVAVLCVGLAFRMVVSFLAVFKLGLSYKEMFFIPFAWLPKATVQAAIGSIALDTARDKSAPADQIELGKQLLTIAVLVILITAPLGAIAISSSAPRLLNKQASPPATTANTTGGDPDDTKYEKVVVV